MRLLTGLLVLLLVAAVGYLTYENARLRERVVAVEQEVDALRDELAAVEKDSSRSQQEDKSLREEFDDLLAAVETLAAVLDPASDLREQLESELEGDGLSQLRSCLAQLLRTRDPGASPACEGLSLP